MVGHEEDLLGKYIRCFAQLVVMMMLQCCKFVVYVMPWLRLVVNGIADIFLQTNQMTNGWLPCLFASYSKYGECRIIEIWAIMWIFHSVLFSRQSQVNIFLPKHFVEVKGKRWNCWRKWFQMSGTAKSSFVFRSMRGILLHTIIESKFHTW